MGLRTFLISCVSLRSNCVLLSLLTTVPKLRRIIKLSSCCVIIFILFSELITNSFTSLSEIAMKSPMTPRTIELFKQNSGNGLLDLLAPEVFYQIMICLEPQDIRMCMCVSKKWKVSEIPLTKPPQAL